MIDPDNTLALWAALFGIVAFGVWAEGTVWGRRLTGTIVILLAALFLANTGILPNSSPVYSTVMSNFVPLALALMLLRVDLKSLKEETGPTLMVFLIGAAGTVAGALSAYYLVSLDAFGPELAGMFAATYIGGSANFVAVADAFGVSGSPVMVPALASDTLMTIAYLVVLTLVPGWRLIAGKAGVRKMTAQKTGRAKLSWGTKDFDILASLLALFLAFLFVAAGSLIQGLTGVPGTALIVITLLAIAAATLFREKIKASHGPFQIGMVLMLVFFAALGANGDISTLFIYGPDLLLFAAVIMAVHFVIIFGLGRLLKFDIAEIATASNACVCGPPTAAGMAADAGWDHLVTPAIVAGSLGFAIANIAGVFVVNFLN